MAPPRITGLLLFIADIRECASTEAEHARILKEIGKIKKMLVNSRNMKGYDRKKCCWKLVYCYLLGYAVDFGYLEIVQLLSSSIYSEKNTGYVSGSLLFLNADEILTLCVNSMKLDMTSHNENFCALALNNFTFICNDEMAENLMSTIIMLADSATNPNKYTRKKAFMCLVKMVRKNPDLLDVDIWRPKLISILAAETDVSILTAVANVILAFLEYDTTGWEPVISSVISAIGQISQIEAVHPYMYYEMPAPWLQVKLMRILQFLPTTEDPASIVCINDLIFKMLLKYKATSLPQPAGSQKLRSRQIMELMNRFNIGHAVLFEVINTAIHYERSLETQVKEMVVAKLGSLLTIKEPNVRYIGLDTMARMVHESQAVDAFKAYTDQIILQLKESDFSVKRQALSLLYGLCDKDNWSYIVNELLDVLKGADNVMQEELVFKIAILVEKNAPDLSWYVDVVFKMFEYAPAFAGDEVWYRVVQVVTGFDEDSVPTDLQVYAARKAFEYLSVDFVHEPVVKLGTYILGEFGHLISDEVTGKEILDALSHHFPMLSNSSKGMMLVSYAKLANVFPEVVEDVLQLLEDLEDSQDVDLQTRACELATLLELDKESIEKAMGMMPTYSSGIQEQNPLVNRLRQSGKTRAQTRVELEDAATSQSALLKGAPPVSQEPPSEEEEGDEGASESEDSESSEAEQSEASEEEEEEDEDERITNRSSAPMKTNGYSNYNDHREERTSTADASAATHAAWRKLCVSKQGILYESNLMRIAMDQSYKGFMAYLVFKIMNPSGSAIIENLNVSVAPMKGFACDVQQEALPPVIKPSEVHSFRIAVKCLSPSNGVPEMTLSGRIQKKNQSITLKLPLILTKFVAPYALPPQNVQKSWEAAGQQNQSVVKGFTSMDFNRITELMGSAFNFESFQMNGHTGFAGVFHAAPAPEDTKPRNVSCMVVMSVENGHLTITARASVGIVSSILCNLLKSYFIR